jgi:hypothetical protein
MVPLLGVILYPVSLLVNEIFSYNVTVLSSIALLSFLTGSVVIALGGGRKGAVLAGALVFYPSMLQYHVARLNVLSAYWFVAVYFFFLLSWRSRAWRWFVSCGLSLVATFYICAYQTVHAMILLGMDVGWRLWLARGRRLHRLDPWLGLTFWLLIGLGWGLLSFFDVLGVCVMLASIGLLGAVLLLDGLRRPEGRFLSGRVIVALLIVLIGVSPFFVISACDERVSSSRVKVDMQTKIYWSAQPLSYCLSKEISSLLTRQGLMGGDDLYRLSGRKEFDLFLGYGVWAILLASLTFGGGTNRNGRWLAFAAVFMILSFGPVLRWGKELNVGRSEEQWVFLPAAVFEFIPLLDGYKVFSRMGVMVLLCLSIFIGLRWDDVARRVLGPLSRGRRGALSCWALTAGLCAAVVVERTQLPAATQEVRVPKFYSLLRDVQKPLRLYTFPENSWTYLYPLTIHRHSMVNHYGSRPDEGLAKRTRDNAFLWVMAAYDHPFPRLLGRPTERPVPEAIRRGFDLLSVDGVIVHVEYLKNRRDRDQVERLFVEHLELERIYDDEGVVFYRNPRGKRFELPQLKRDLG